MTTFEDLLLQNKEAIIQRWLEAALSAYPAESSAAFVRQKDPFANPVGHSLRVGTRGIFEALLGGADSAEVDQHLRDMIRIRAVQEFSASQTLGFIFALKDAVRVEMGRLVQDPRLAAELGRLDGQIDRIALAAFDIFVACRERVCELRVNEIKRQVAWILGKMNAGGLEPESARIDRDVTTPEEGG